MPLLRPGVAVLSSSITITPYKRRYRNDVRELMFQSYRTHSHLDWHETDYWLDAEESPVRLAWAGGRLVGLLAMAQPLHETTWVRLAAVADELQPQLVLDALWADLSAYIRTLGVHTVALLIMRDWLMRYISPLGFRYVEDIVTLRRPPNAGTVTVERLPGLQLLPGDPDQDVDIITALDQAAFAPPWQLAEAELRQAVRVSSQCIRAVIDGQLVGYQISTLYFDGGHLARLGVLPEMQGRGIGGALVADLIQRFAAKGIHSVTVNTQSSNTASQRLYARYGFLRNGHDLPVWMATL